MTNFDPQNKDHVLLVRQAMTNADQFGASRLRTAREQLDLYDIAIPNERQLSDLVFKEGASIRY